MNSSDLLDRFALEELAAIRLYATIPSEQEYQHELPVCIPIPYSADFNSIYEGLKDIGEQCWKDNKISLDYLKDIHRLCDVHIESISHYTKFSDKLSILFRSLHSHQLRVPGVTTVLHLGLCRVNFHTLAQLSQDLYIAARNIQAASMDTLTAEQLSSRCSIAFRDVFIEFGGFNKTKSNIIEPYNEEEIQKVKKYFNCHRNHRA